MIFDNENHCFPLEKQWFFNFWYKKLVFILLKHCKNKCFGNINTNFLYQILKNHCFSKGKQWFSLSKITKPYKYNSFVDKNTSFTNFTNFTTFSKKSLRRNLEAGDQAGRQPASQPDSYKSLSLYIYIHCWSLHFWCMVDLGRHRDHIYIFIYGYIYI